MFLWLCLKQRIWFYSEKKSVKRTLTTEQIMEILDSKFIIGIIGFFYVTNILSFYIEFCNIMNYDVSQFVLMFAQFFIVMNSSIKFIIYAILSKSFRSDLIQLFK